MIWGTPILGNLHYININIYYIYIYYNVVIPKRKKNMIYHTISNLMFDLFRIYYIRATAKPRQY